ncbi:MAG: hypothetical protein EXS16_19385 [Gemmataceae bacterium]|nr:hypothetical protein [Gemmataceae bacterium]
MKLWRPRVDLNEFVVEDSEEEEHTYKTVRQRNQIACITIRAESLNVPIPRAGGMKRDDRARSTDSERMQGTVGSDDFAGGHGGNERDA